MGRGKKLTKEKIKEICTHIENGNTNIRACILSNICESIFYEWKSKGEKDKEDGKETIYVEFMESQKVAQAKFIDYHLQQICISSGEGNTTDSKWLLERKYPNEFGNKERLDINKTSTKKIEVNLTDDKLFTIGEILANAGAFDEEEGSISIDPETD